MASINDDGAADDVMARNGALGIKLFRARFRVKAWRNQ